MRTTRRLAVGIGALAMVLLLGVGGAAAGTSQGSGDSGGDACTEVTGVDVQLLVRGGPLVVESCTSTDAVVVGDSDVLVDRDALVDGPVVVVNGTAVIRGTVTGDVVVLRGQAVIERTATVEGDVVSSRQPRVSDRAEVDGSVHRVQFTAILNGIGIAARIAWWVAISVSTLVAGLIFAGAFGGVARRTVEVGRRAVAPALGAGVIAAFGVPFVCGLLLFTLVATPLGLVGLAAMAPLYLLGYVAGAVFLGNLMLKERTGLVWSFVLGWFILRVVGALPFLGGLLTLAATVYGLGALLVAAWQLTRSIPAPAPAPSPDAGDGAIEGGEVSVDAAPAGDDAATTDSTTTDTDNTDTGDDDVTDPDSSAAPSER